MRSMGAKYTDQDEATGVNMVDMFYADWQGQYVMTVDGLKSFLQSENPQALSVIGYLINAGNLQGQMSTAAQNLANQVGGGTPNVVDFTQAIVDASGPSVTAAVTGGISDSATAAENAVTGTFDFLTSPGFLWAAGGIGLLVVAVMFYPEIKALSKTVIKPKPST